jgi:hypothetical protein
MDLEIFLVNLECEISELFVIKQSFQILDKVGFGDVRKIDSHLSVNKAGIFLNYYRK